MEKMGRMPGITVRRWKISLAAALAAALVLCLASAADSFAAGDFIIRDYAVNMVVSEDDTYQITETVKVEFTAPSHGIYVNIPLRTELDRDGQKSSYYAEVRDFRMLTDQPYSVDDDRSAFHVKIGDPDRYAETQTTYRYSYVYDTGGDRLRDADEVYHDLVGTGWEARRIEHVSFEVVFPKPVDTDDIGIKTGKQIYVPFEAVDERTIEGETTENCLGGLTIRAVLPQGYFTREAEDPVWLLWIVDGILALTAVCSVFMAGRYGRDPEIPCAPEFYPPDGITAPEAAYILNEELGRGNISSLLLSLADKGYVRIHEYRGETAGKQSRKAGKKKKTEGKYRIEKLRSYDGGDPYEAMFMEGLFANGDIAEADDLRDSFYETADKIIKAIEQKYEPMAYDEETRKKADIIKMAGTAGLILLLTVTVFISGALRGMGFFAKLAAVAIPIVMIGGALFNLSENVRARRRAGSYVVTGVIMAIGLIVFIYPGIAERWQLIPLAAGMVLCVLIFVFAGFCDKKTEEFAKLKARVRGYADFLKTAEKDQMETLAESDPDYYFRNLAFAFALGVTAAYAKRFASMVMKEPEWYSSDVHSFSHGGTAGMLGSINSMTQSVSSSMSSSPSSGGSFSGGGGGGGSGGGSW